MPSTAAALPPPLLEGDRLDAAEFLRRWEAMPNLKFAELIDGVVFLGSPRSLDDGTLHYDLTGWLSAYSSRTPGCRGGNDATWLMGDRDAPQPDIFLRILPEWGGQSKVSAGGKYGSGAPELVVEVAVSSQSRDLGVKKQIYEAAGVLEYLTVEVSRRRITWRLLAEGRYRELQPDRDGIIRSRAFPGLWMQPDALWTGELGAAGEKGLLSPEHEEFVQRLAAARRSTERQ